MKIAVIGAGKVGGTLGRRWADRGHEVLFGVRDPQSPKVKELLQKTGANARAVEVPEAAAGSDVVALALPWEATQEAIVQCGDLSGKVVLDCTNPVVLGPRATEGLAVGNTTSGGEEVAKWATGAHVVKSFNTMGWEQMSDPHYDEGQPIMLYAGDDAGAKAIVAQLAREIGFDAQDAGPLMNARYLEPMGIMWVYLATNGDLGRGNIAWRLMKR